MQIKIAERLKPFSHISGTYVVLPYSPYRLQIYPAKLVIEDISSDDVRAVACLNFAIDGPLDDFTVMQDLEAYKVIVFGRAENGFFRYSLNSLFKTNEVEITFEKVPQNTLNVTTEGCWKDVVADRINQGQKIKFKDTLIKCSFSQDNVERLSLGSSKALDWELIRRRQDFATIFPLWHRLGQLIPQFPTSPRGGNAILLTKCQQAIDSNAPEHLLGHFRKLFLASFEGALSPRVVDAEFQGIVNPLSKFEGSSLQLLSEGAKLIRSLFIQEKETRLHLLPALPPEFHCGRLLTASWGKGGKLDMEWTKKALRRVVLTSNAPAKLSLVTSKGEKSCRLRHSFTDGGCLYIPGTELTIEPGRNYWFDNFER